MQMVMRGEKHKNHLRRMFQLPSTMTRHVDAAAMTNGLGIYSDEAPLQEEQNQPPVEKVRLPLSNNAPRLSLSTFLPASTHLKLVYKVEGYREQIVLLYLEQKDLDLLQH